MHDNIQNDQTSSIEVHPPMTHNIINVLVHVTTLVFGSLDGEDKYCGWVHYFESSLKRTCLTNNNNNNKFL